MKKIETETEIEFAIGMTIGKGNVPRKGNAQKKKTATGRLKIAKENIRNQHQDAAIRRIDELVQSKWLIKNNMISSNLADIETFSHFQAKNIKFKYFFFISKI